MPRLTEDELKEIVRDTDYISGAVEKTAKLLDILQAIADDDFLSPRLALKGGTAINAFFLRFPRLSVDIDLNYIGHQDEGVMEAERPEVDRALLGILEANGCRLRSRPRIGGKWRLGFDRLNKQTARLEIDINYREREPLFGTARMTSSPLGSRSAGGVLVLDPREVIAAKLAALFKRTLARDLFDGLSILEMRDLDWEGIRPAFIMFSVASNQRWEDVSIDTAGHDPHMRCQRLLYCLPGTSLRGKEEAVAWHDEAVMTCRRRFAHLVDLGARERAFVDAVFERAEVDATLLDPPPALLGPIARSGALAHRCEEVLKAREDERGAREDPQEGPAPGRKPPGRGMGF